MEEESVTRWFEVVRSGSKWFEVVRRRREEIERVPRGES